MLQSKKRLKCYQCGKRWHVKKDCWHKKDGAQMLPLWQKRACKERKDGGKNPKTSISQGCVASRRY